MAKRVVIAGGGPAGAAAAIAAARAGAQAILVERYGFLGGMATAALVHPWMPYYAGDRPIIGGVFGEIVQRLKARNAYKDSRHFASIHHCFDPEQLKLVLQQLALEAGVKLLLHSLVVGARVEGGQVTGLFLESKSGRELLEGEVIVDATGDGDVAFFAGAEHEKGRPGDGLMQPMSLNFRMGGVEVARMPSREEMNALYEQGKQEGLINNPRENLLWFDTTRPDEIHFNTTRVVMADGTNRDDLTRAELESRRQTDELVSFLRARVPGFERSYLLTTGPQVGVRETRRILGEYVMTAEDVLEARKFPDQIAFGCYPIDIHNPAGTGTEIRTLKPGEFYGIPYRCLVPRRLEGLLVAGRPISTTHEAHAATRVQVIAYATGHAAGVAAALAASQGLPPRQVNVSEVQALLRRQGAILDTE
jgi:glycine/D-amino acid oxidase-like deaminating enzyme